MQKAMVQWPSVQGNPPLPNDVNLNRNSGWKNNNAQNNRPRVNNWSNNTSIGGSQRRMRVINQISATLRQHVKTSYHLIGFIFGEKGWMCWLCFEINQSKKWQPWIILFWTESLLCFSKIEWRRKGWEHELWSTYGFS